MTLLKTKTNTDRFQGLFDTFLFPERPDRNGNGYNSRQTFPLVNIKEGANEFLLELAAPGMKKNDFKIQLDQDLLTVSSDRKEENEKEDPRFYSKKEFSYLNFKRSFTLPETADTESIAANYLNGILLIHIPKKEEAKPQPPRSIKIT